MGPNGHTKTNLMAHASLFLGIVAILSVLNVYYAIFLGSMGMLLATLSRGEYLKMPKKAVTGFTLSALAVTASILLTVLSLYLLLDMFGLETLMDPEALQEAINNLYSNLMNGVETNLSTGGNIL